MEKEIEEIYGNRVRIRVCGLCWRDDQLLVIDHHHLGTPHFWAPPGGGVEFGVNLHESLVKEFLEETGLHVTVGDFLFSTEFIKPPLHAIELFFLVNLVTGTLQAGHDPETKLPVIGAAAFKSLEEICALPSNHRHGIFNTVKTPLDLRNLRGYIRFL